MMIVVMRNVFISIKRSVPQNLNGYVDMDHIADGNDGHRRGNGAPYHEASLHVVPKRIQRWPGNPFFAN